MDRYVYVFKDKGCSELLVSKSNKPLKFDTVIDAAKYLVQCGISNDDIVKFHYSHLDGRSSLPCSKFTAMSARRIVKGLYVISK